MDFASLMSKEISKAAPSKSAASSDKKYQKRADLEAERRAAYEAEQAAIAAEREARAAKKRKIEEEEAELLRQREEKKRRLAEETRAKREAAAKEEERLRRKRLGLPDLVEEEKLTKDTEAVDGDDIDDEELFTKLREMGEPVTLFGEGHKQRLKRYRRLYDAKQLKLSSGPIPTTLELVPETEMKVPAKMPTDPEGQKYVTRQLASYFTMVLREWEEAMEKEKQDTSTSRTAYIAMTQTRENMKPLFRQFENGSLDTSLLSSITEIVLAAQERRYVDANDGYLRLSIGKAAWPIGVTMVGIHERSAREKLHETDKGHVMGDEATRKFMQSIKRCLSFAQVRWPPEDLRQLMG